MTKQNWERLQPTFSLEDDRLIELKQIVPEAFTDGKIDFDLLRELLGSVVDDDTGEHFGLNWTGKREARRLAGMPSKGTLAPVPGKGLHEDTTENIFIEGDNLEVLKLLHKSYRGKIKMIYIDPPYNTGNDFIYKDDYRMPLESYLQRSGQKSDMGELLTSNPKSSGRFHSDWLNMMYPRLRVAKDLLREDGVIFVSIDDNEVTNLRAMLGEIFGEENFISQIVIQSNKRGQTYKEIAKTHEYLLLFSLGEDYSIFELPKPDDSLPFEDVIGRFDLWELRNRNPKFGRHNRPNLFYPIYVSPKLKEDGYAAVSLEQTQEFSEKIEPFDSTGRESCWRWGKDTVSEAIKKGDSVLVAKKRRDGKWNIYEKSRKSTTSPKSLWTETDVISEQGTTELGQLGMGKYFDHPKPLGLLNKVLKIATEQDDLVLDFFAGSGSLAHAVFALNQEDDANRRHIISVQLDEQISSDHEAYKTGFRTVSDITAERMRRASKATEPLSINSHADFGFKTYSLSASNFRAWSDYQGNDLDELRGLLQAQLDSTFVDGATDDAILTEILLLEGFALTSQIEMDGTFQKNSVRRISHEWCEHRLFVTLDKEIQEETIRQADGLDKTDIFICLDNALTDQDKLRLADVCRLKTI